MFKSMHRGKTRDFTSDSISVIDMAKKTQMREERDYNDLYEGMKPEDIEYMQRDDGGDDEEADKVEMPELPGISSEGTIEETQMKQEK